MKITKGYTFDDVLLVPKHSNISSRRNIDTSVNLGKGIKLEIPICSANMKHVTNPLMARTIAKLGGLALLHRFDTPENQIKNLEDVFDLREPFLREFGWDICDRVGVSVGIHDGDKQLVDRYLELGVKIIAIDVAHGDHENVGEMIKYVKKLAEERVLIIAGNVATYNGALFLRDCGADVIKAGIGNGSICLTRIETGNGVPQLTALSDICESSLGIKVIADGGIKITADAVKSLVFADCVMLGNLLAGTSDSPGEIISIEGKQYKEYAGSSTHKTSHVEGVIGLVPYKGETKKIIEHIMDGIRSGMSYQGVSNLVDLKKDPEFVSISNAGLIESRAHDVWVR